MNYKKTIRILIPIFGVVILTVLMNLIYLPGPKELYKFSNSLYNLFQILFLLFAMLFLIGITWLIRNVQKSKPIYIPLIMIIISFAVIINDISISRIFRNYARNYTIEEANIIIEKIEQYNSKYEHYPESLNELVPEYLEIIQNPGIIGVRKFEYHKMEDSYELVFTQNVIFDFNVEIVVYNPNETQKAYGEFPELNETGNPKWKYFILD